MTPPAAITPAQRADSAHYLTRHIAQALHRCVFRSEEEAFSIAHQVVSELSRIIPGYRLRVPAPQVQAPSQPDQQAIALSIINRSSEESIPDACRRLGVSERTGYRLVNKFR